MGKLMDDEVKKGGTPPKEYQFKKGEPSGNPLGRPKGSINKKYKQVTSALRALGKMEAPAEWFEAGLEMYRGEKLTIEELIALRVVYCAARGIRYNADQAFKEYLNRLEGKTPLRVLHKPEDEGDEFGELTSEEIDLKIKEIVERAKKPELTEGTPDGESQDQ